MRERCDAVLVVGRLERACLLLRHQPVFEPRQAVHVTSELGDGALLPRDSMEDIRQLASMSMSGLSKLIHIEALTVQLALQGA